MFIDSTVSDTSADTGNPEAAATKLSNLPIDGPPEYKLKIDTSADLSAGPETDLLKKKLP